VDHIVLSDKPARPATEPARWADYGRDFYAAVSWSDIPKSDARRLWIGWMSSGEYANDVPTSPWRSAMSVPRELTLRATPEGFRLIQQPARELRRLRGQHHQLTDASFIKAQDWLASLKVNGPLLELEARFATSETTGDFGFKMVNGIGEETVVRCDLTNQRLSIDRTRSGKTDFHAKFPGVHQAPFKVRDGQISLRVLLDTSSIEVFGNDGEAVLTDLILPNSGERMLKLFSDATPPRVRELHVWELKSAWR
jgi:fructan beta-fructosidase